MKLQRELIEDGARVLVIVEGRDAAGKDGTIKRLTEHMSPRDTRVYAPGKPSDRETSEWYFQRFIPHLPAGGEFVIFNRSWYNRAGVERVMGFCTKTELKQFFTTVGDFESLLVRAGIELRKYYLDISRKEQKKRLLARQKDPLKTWKNSPIDAAALKNGTPTPRRATKCSSAPATQTRRGASCSPTTSTMRGSRCSAIFWTASTTRARAGSW